MTAEPPLLFWRVLSDLSCCCTERGQKLIQVLGAIPAERADQQVLLQRLHLRFREALYRVLLKRLLRDVLGEFHESAAALECTKPAA